MCLRSGEEEEEEKNKNKFWEGVVRDTALASIARKVAEYLMAVKFPSQCRLVILVKLHWKQRVAVEARMVKGWKVECLEYATDESS